MNFPSFWLNLALDRHQVYSKRYVYERVLDEIGNAIGKSCTKTQSTEDLPPELIDQITDEETEVIEYLLGTAFVLCQAYITDVVSTVISLHEFAKSKNISLKTTTRKKHDVLRFGYKGDGFSPAEVMDGFSNYFKHRDEWGFNWQKLLKKNQKTVKIIQSVGAESGCTGNLRQGSTALGNPDFVETVIFLDKLEQWHLDLIDAYRAEFEKVFTEKSSDTH